MTIDLGNQRLAGTTATDGEIQISDITIPLDTDNWTTTIDDYPMLVNINGEIVQAGGATLSGGKVTLTGVARALNGVIKSHDPGTVVRPAHEFRLGLNNRGIQETSGSPPPPTTDPLVDFWDIYDVLASAPVSTLAALGHPTPNTPITRAELDGILDAWVAGTGGTTHIVTSEATWTTAMAAVVPGDLVRCTQSFTLSADLVCRGNKYGISGSNLTASPTGGTSTLPIILTCADGVVIDRVSQTGNSQALTIRNVDHIWCVGFNTTNGHFAANCRNLDGTASSPVRFAWCTFSNTGDSGLALQGWFEAIGSPPAGAGNEWGFSSYIVVEQCTISGMGQVNTQFGECVYLGLGSSDDYHKGRAHHIWIRFNDLEECTADFLDVKPGSHHVYFYGNTLREGAFDSGSAMQILYRFNTNARPAYNDFDPEIYILFNRIWDGNLTNPVGGSSNYVCQTSYTGVRFAFNECWGFASGGVGFRLRSEAAASETQSSDGEVWTVVNNLFWLGDGVANVGSNEPALTAFSGSLIDARNNLGASTTTNVEATAVTTDFRNQATIPAVGAAGTADWDGYGPGAAFDIDPASALVGTGTDISDLDLYINGLDISKRSVSTSPTPGPFQPA